MKSKQDKSPRQGKSGGFPVRKPVQARSIEKKDRVIEAAYKLYNQKEYDLVNIRMIAEEAKVSVGTIYSYFHDKRDIFMEARKLYRDEMYRRFLKAIEKTLSNSDSAESVMMTFLQTFEDVIRRFAVFHKQNMILSLTDEKLGTDQMSLEWENAKVVTEIFHKKFKRYICRPLSDATIFVIYRILKEIVEVLLFFPVEIPREEVFRETSRMLANYLIGEK